MLPVHHGRDVEGPEELEAPPILRPFGMEEEKEEGEPDTRMAHPTEGLDRAAR